MTIHFPFQNTYSALPANFFARVAPTPVAAPRLIKLNRALAVQLGLDPDVLETPEGAEILAGNRVPEGAEPIATAYAGHQFGQFVPQLGDGRAILLGEIVDRGGVRGDVDGVRVLADHVIERHYPRVGRAEQRYRALLDAVVQAQAELVAQWQM